MLSKKDKEEKEEAKPGPPPKAGTDEGRAELLAEKEVDAAAAALREAESREAESRDNAEPEPEPEPEPQAFTKDNMPKDGWKSYRKTKIVQALHVNGPFTTETREGTLSMDDGYLVKDSEGYPYPVAYDEFNKTYESVEAKPEKDEDKSYKQRLEEAQRENQQLHASLRNTRRDLDAARAANRIGRS